MATWRVRSSYSDDVAVIEGRRAGEEEGDFVIRDARGDLVFRLPADAVVSVETVDDGGAEDLGHTLDPSHLHDSGDDDYFFDLDVGHASDESHRLFDDRDVAPSPPPPARKPPPVRTPPTPADAVERPRPEPARREPEPAVEPAPAPEGAPADYDIASIADLARALEALTSRVYRRYNATVDGAEAGRLGAEIGMLRHQIEKYLETLGEGEAYVYRVSLERVDEEIRNYRNVLRSRDARAERPKRKLSPLALEAKLDHLAALAPVEFAKYLGTVYEAHGWRSKLVNDPNGRDQRVVVMRDRATALIHVKSYGSGILIARTDVEILKHLASRLGCNRGIFVTLNTFTVQAEQYAMDENIELVDRARLKEMIREAWER